MRALRTQEKTSMPIDSKSSPKTIQPKRKPVEGIPTTTTQFQSSLLVKRSHVTAIEIGTIVSEEDPDPAKKLHIA